uniref:Uncharacterized protein n=1 Tax=Leclercia adecarboxylata TaxID=83655 RepID=A0A482LZ02_9ENTR|nr:Hypothetical protein [Leclercia adecarboxylata]
MGSVHTGQIWLLRVTALEFSSKMSAKSGHVKFTAFCARYEM